MAACLCQALDDYTAIVVRHPSLAITEYARLSRALMLFQNGRAGDAVLQLDDLRVSMIGCASPTSSTKCPTLAECHAATMKSNTSGLM